jgi:ATP-dependent protease ClpP protease subunit
VANWYSIKAEGSGPAIVYLYGVIGQDWWGDGNSAKDFAQELDALAPRDIDLRINSEGGDVFEGYAIYSALNRYPGRVTAFVDGLAASAASFVALAANEVVMGAASFFMIHNAWTIALGNAAELRQIAERLDAVDDQIIGIYEKHTDRDTDAIRAALSATTWLTGPEAVEWGFASRVDESLKAAACVSRDFAAFTSAIPEGVTVSDTAPAVDAALDAPTDEQIVDDGQEPDVEGAGQEPEPVLVTVRLSSGHVVRTLKQKE